ncbi:MAG: hypothetical protein ACI4UA_07845 [Bacteroidaceae bacterium]
MKRKQLFIWLCLLPAFCHAQMVSLRVADTWIELNREEMQTEIKPGWSIAGRKLKDKRVLYLWGKTSRQMTDDRRPELRVEPEEKETLVDYALIRLDVRRDHRRLPKPILRENSYTRLEPTDFSIRPDGKQAFVCRPLNNLPSGEYILVCLEQTVEKHQAGYRVHAFSIP